MASYIGGVMTPGATSYWDAGEGGDGRWIAPAPAPGAGYGNISGFEEAPYQDVRVDPIIAPGAGYGNIGGGGEIDDNQADPYDSQDDSGNPLPFPILRGAPVPLPIQPLYPPAVAVPTPTDPVNKIDPDQGNLWDKLTPGDSTSPGEVLTVPGWIMPSPEDQEKKWNQADPLGTDSLFTNLGGMMPLLLMMMLFKE